MQLNIYQLRIRLSLKIISILTRPERSRQIKAISNIVNVHVQRLQSEKTVFPKYKVFYGNIKTLSMQQRFCYPCAPRSCYYKALPRHRWPIRLDHLNDIKNSTSLFLCIIFNIPKGFLLILHFNFGTNGGWDDGNGMRRWDGFLMSQHFPMAFVFCLLPFAPVSLGFMLRRCDGSP